MATTDRARAAMGMDAQRQQQGAGREVATVEKRIAETRAMEAAFADAVAQGLSPQTLVRDAITAIRTTPKLAECTSESFFGALMTAAQLGLRPNVATLGHGWVLPRWNGRKQVNEASWQLGYQGMVELGYRSRLVEKITAHTIYDGEHHRIQWGTNDVLEHEPLQDPRQRGPMLWHYAVVWLKTGGVIWNAITEAEAQQTMRGYAAKDRNGNVVGPWVANYLPMARKTALRGLWRYMPKTPELALALTTDDVVREGMSKDAAVDGGEPEGSAAVTLTVATEQAPQPEAEPLPDEPPADEPVDAEVVPEPEPEPAGMPDEWPTAQGPRKRFDDNQARKAYAAKLAATHGTPEAVAEVIRALHGEVIPLAYLSTAELRAAADYRPSGE
jgi:recombination protein RecT